MSCPLSFLNLLLSMAGYAVTFFLSFPPSRNIEDLASYHSLLHMTVGASFPVIDVTMTLYRLCMTGCSCQGLEAVPVFTEEDQLLKYMKDGVILEDGDPALEMKVLMGRGAARAEMIYRLPQI